jgi:cytochrome c-type biogenesis protein CcmH/NrfG
MSLTLAEKNSLLRDAVSERLDRKLHRENPDEPYVEHLLEQHRLRGDGITHEQQPVTVAEQTLQGAIEAVRDRHTKYGPPVEHFGRTAFLVNAAFGTTFTPADWALVMVLDKVARLRGPTPTTDGGIDIAGYASCYEECRSRG